MGIFIGVPVYHGWEFVDETLRSIQAQEFHDFRVLISVDANDLRSAEICSRYLGVSRAPLGSDRALVSARRQHLPPGIREIPPRFPRAPQPRQPP